MDKVSEVLPEAPEAEEHWNLFEFLFGLLALLGLRVLPATLFLSIWGVQYLFNLPLGWASRSFEPVTATVTLFDPRQCPTHGGKPSGSSGPRPLGVHYVYQFGGNAYSSDRVVAGFDNTFLPDCGRRLFRWIKNNPYGGEPIKEIKAYVNPRNPSQAVLVRGLPLASKSRAGLVSIVLSSLIITAIIRIIARERREKRSQ